MPDPIGDGDVDVAQGLTLADIVHMVIMETPSGGDDVELARLVAGAVLTHLAEHPGELIGAVIEPTGLFEVPDVTALMVAEAAALADAIEGDFGEFADENMVEARVDLAALMRAFLGDVDGPVYTDDDEAVPACAPELYRLVRQ